MELKENIDNKLDKHVIINRVSYKESNEWGIVVKKNYLGDRLRSFWEDKIKPRLKRIRSQSQKVHIKEEEWAFWKALKREEKAHLRTEAAGVAI